MIKRGYRAAGGVVWMLLIYVPRSLFDSCYTTACNIYTGKDLGTKVGSSIISKTTAKCGIQGTGVTSPMTNACVASLVWPKRTYAMSSCSVKIYGCRGKRLFPRCCQRALTVMAVSGTIAEDRSAQNMFLNIEKQMFATNEQVPRRFAEANYW